MRDHQVQEATLLPGALYVSVASEAFIAARQDTNNAEVLQLTQVNFLRPRSLSGTEQVTLQANDVQPQPNAPLCQGSVTDGENTLVEFYAAALPAPSINRLPAPAILEQDVSSAFYQRLQEVGNQYGAAFQPLRNLQTKPEQAAATVMVPAPAAPLRIHPVLIDALVQTLAACVAEPEGPYLLSAVANIELDLRALQRALSTGGTLHSIAARKSSHEDASQITGDVQLLAANGEVLIAMQDVSLVYPQAKPPEQRIGIAATFTAEPLADAVAFWGAHFQAPLQASFAPYNQVHQQLLDPGSVLAHPQNAANVLLFCWQDWVQKAFRPLTADETARQRVEAEHATKKLPAGIQVAHLNPYETDYVFNEIWVDRCYLKHGVSLEDCQCVLDIGANIGLFSLFVKQHAPDAKVYSFEPSPRAHAALTANAEMYGGGSITPLPCGAGEHDGHATFTFYEASSVFSSFYADAGEDHAAVEAIVANMVRTSLGEDAAQDAIDAAVASFMNGRMNSQTLQCELRNVSSIIRQHNIDRIDLLKLDAEKSELPVLRGIADEHWPMIRQVVVEVHDREGPVLAEVQSILESRGFEVAVEEETLLHGSGLFNVFAIRPGQNKTAAQKQQDAADVSARVEEFVANLQAFASTNITPLLLMSCPPHGEEGSSADHQQVERQIAAALQPYRHIQLLTSQEISQLYPVAEIHDAQANALGHVPYTSGYFTALGACVARHWLKHRAPAPKVIVLDCDQTLWGGVCGEDGASGVTLDEHRIAFQQRMVELMNQGLLLAVCSKNTPADVEAVFNGREMPLKREHFTGWKVNWNAKSQNLHELAAELNLGLDSFIFIDDNPLECADVAANCPGVLVMPCPAESRAILPMLDHVWSLDLQSSSDEDSRRTQMYRDEASRQQARAAAPTLKSFIDSLQLQVRIAPVTPAQLPRAAQLTQRTNQFNASTIRRSEAELQQLLDNGHSVHMVHVQDRFGDYGDTGLLIFQIAAGVLHVDTLLLSCRVLGRGVEHQLLAHLGRIAMEQGATRIEIPFEPTERNQPARDFLASHCIGQPFTTSAESAASVQYNPQAAATATAAPLPQQQPSRRQLFNEPLAQIATELQTVEQISQATQATQRRPRPAELPAETPPANDLERNIAAIWCELLKLESVGVCDAFKDVGGTSLLAVQLIARLKSSLDIDLPVVQLFERPTIRQIAAYLSNSADSQPAEDAAATARDRASRRKARAASRRRG